MQWTWNRAQYFYANDVYPLLTLKYHGDMDWVNYKVIIQIISIQSSQFGAPRSAVKSKITSPN